MTHTHDGIEWTDRLAALRRADEIGADSNRTVAERLVGLVRPGATVVDVGSGAGGMSAALAVALDARGGGRVVLADAVSELLSSATAHVEQALGSSAGRVEMDTVLVDAASGGLQDAVSGADLVWASRVVHHLPDQRKGIEGLVKVLGDGGWLALAEGGLSHQCLPWDVGVGEPGLTDRLTAAGNAWFADMRASMPGVVRLPVGWGRAMADSGLADVSSFSYLIDLPAPASEEVRLSVVDWLAWAASTGEDRLSESDRDAVHRLLDPDDPAYAGARDDVFILSAMTVHLGRKSPG